MLETHIGAGHAPPGPELYEKRRRYGLRNAFVEWSDRTFPLGPMAMALLCADCLRAGEEKWPLEWYLEARACGFEPTLDRLCVFWSGRFKKNDGNCSGHFSYWEIRIRNSLGREEVVRVVIHEMAHVLENWLFKREGHSSTFKKVHSHLMQKLFWEGFWGADFRKHPRRRPGDY